MLKKPLSKSEVLKKFKGEPERWDGTHPLSEAAIALRETLARREHQRNYYRKLCEWSQEDPEHFVMVLAEEGHNFSREEVRDAMLELAPELHPNTKAGRRDVRAELYRQAMAWVWERGGDLELLDEPMGELNDAWCDGTLLEFRRLLRSRALRAAREGVAL